MKTASVLFGLITAACGSTQPEASYPLCDPQGAPACGNIGQVGRARETTVIDKATALPIAATTVAETAVIRVVPIVNVLLGASHEREVPQGRDPITASIIERRGLQVSPRKPRAATQPSLTPTASATSSGGDRRLHVSARQTSSTQPFARPLADNREEVVCGNVMGKGSSRRICRNGAGVVVSETSAGYDDGSATDEN